MEYRVTWVIDLDAESFEDAARPLGKRGLYQASLRARGRSPVFQPPTHSPRTSSSRTTAATTASLGRFEAPVVSAQGKGKRGLYQA